eukprot:gene10393-2922_t
MKKKKFVFVNEEQNMKIQSSKVVKTKKWLKNTGAMDKDYKNFHSFSTKPAGKTTKHGISKRQFADIELQKVHLTYDLLTQNYSKSASWMFMIDMNSRLLWMNTHYKRNSKKNEEDLMKPQMEQQGVEASTLGSLFPMLIQETPKTYSTQTDPVTNDNTKESFIFLINFTRIDYLNGTPFGYMIAMDPVSMNKKDFYKELVVKVTYEDYDFIEKKVTDRDFEFMKFLLKDSTNWELLNHFRNGEYGQRIGSIFYTETNYLPNINLFKERVVSKYDITLPYDFEHVLSSFIPLSQQCKCEDWLTNYETLGFIEGLGFGDRHHTVFTQFLSLPFPYTARIAPGVASAICTDDYFLLISKPCEINSLQDHQWGENKDVYCKIRKEGNEKKNKVYKMFDFNCTLIQRINSQKTLFSQIHLFSLGGWIKNKTSLRPIVQDRGNHLILGLIENLKRQNSIKSILELKTKKFYESDGLAQLLTAHESDLIQDLSSMIVEDSFDFSNSELLSMSNQTFTNYEEDLNTF